MRRPTVSLLAALLLPLLLAACKTTENRTQSNKRGPITQQEMLDSGLTFGNAYDVVRQLRPSWLIERGISTLTPSTVDDTLLDFIAVYVDRQLMGDPGTLRRISPVQIQTIEFLDTGRAQRLGSRSHIHGAIVLTTRTE